MPIKKNILYHFVCVPDRPFRDFKSSKSGDRGTLRRAWNVDQRILSLQKCERVGRALENKNTRILFVKPKNKLFNNLWVSRTGKGRPSFSLLKNRALWTFFTLYLGKHHLQNSTQPG